MWLTGTAGDDLVYIGASRKPLLDGARYMLREGLAAVSDKLYTKWKGSEHWSMRASVGIATSKDVSEGSTKGPYIVPYHEVDYSSFKEDKGDE
jgi:hypothetical protein